jgi:hypothetical protein
MKPHRPKTTMNQPHMKACYCSLFFVVLAGCPQVNSKACVEDTECSPGQRCRRGACGPICLNDAECGSAQVCADGVCRAAPECTEELPCAMGFTCQLGRCVCTTDAACPGNQRCVAGACQSAPRCTSDEQCRGQGRCEVVSGTCLPVCQFAANCAPDLDARLALALYVCVDGTCSRRCTIDNQCGASGFVCEDSRCQRAVCTTRTDCPTDQYCTGASAGRCANLTTCTDNAACSLDFTCQRLTGAACPPGLDCTQRICLELPRCIADQDCVAVADAGVAPTGFCERGHCQPSARCQTLAACASGLECIGNRCVPYVCRSRNDCDAGLCLDGRCTATPTPTDVSVLNLWAEKSVAVVGEPVRLHLLASSFAGAVAPVSAATFSVEPANAATISDAGVLVGLTAGPLTVRGRLVASAASPASVSLVILPAAEQRRVVVVNAATHLPVAQSRVFVCQGGCSTSVEVGTDDAGIALLSGFDGGVTVTVIGPGVRSDGKPRFERVTVIDAQDDTLIPLRDNAASAETGLSSTVSFTDVSTSGGYWAGLVLPSAGDLTNYTPQRLVGETFAFEIPGVAASVPLPASLVLYTSPAFGIPQEVKPRAFTFAESGIRVGVALAARGNVEQLALLRSVDLLGYLGAADVDVGPEVEVAPRRPLIVDTVDVDADGLCANPTRCPAGTELVPDYAGFTRTTLRPKRGQRLRTEVVLARLPSTFSSVLAGVFSLSPRVGGVPLGFASATPGTVGRDGTRAVGPIQLKSAPPFNGLEVYDTAVWAVATDPQGRRSSGVLAAGERLNPRTVMRNWLPALEGTIDANARAFVPTAASWASAISGGAQFARVTATGVDVSHTIYAPTNPGQLRIGAPSIPTLPASDPWLDRDAALEVVVIAPTLGATVAQLTDAAGVNLLWLAPNLSAWSRFER